MPDSDAPPIEWLSREEAHQLVRVPLGVKTSRTLLRWADSGKIRSIRTPGGHRRFDRADLERLIVEGVVPLDETG